MNSRQRRKIVRETIRLVESVLPEEYKSDLLKEIHRLSSALSRVEGLEDEVMAWRERFPTYTYLAHDNYVVLRESINADD